MIYSRHIKLKISQINEFQGCNYSDSQEVSEFVRKYWPTPRSFSSILQDIQTDGRDAATDDIVAATTTEAGTATEVVAATTTTTLIDT